MALATLAEIRAGLQTRLATITGLQSFAYLPPSPPLPCAFVGGVREVTYHESMVLGLNSWVLSVWVLVSNAVPTVEAQADLDLFVSPTGTNSIVAAIEGGTTGQTLVGKVGDVVVERCDGYAVYVTETGSYFGAEFTVRVQAGA